MLGIEPGREIDVYRIVRSDNTDNTVRRNSFKSHYELGDEPRNVEVTSTVLHMGISVYLTEDAARGTALRFRKLGDYVTHLRLPARRGVNYAHTGHPGHLTLWADPIKLLDSVVDTQPVEH